MKIKLDFVTNSSSESFCIFGAKIITQINLNDEQFLPLKNNIIEFYNRKDDVLAYPDGYFYSYLDSTRNIKIITDGYDGSLYIGFSLDSLNNFDDNKTIKEIKQQIVYIVKEELFLDVDIENIKFYEGEVVC